MWSDLILSYIFFLWKYIVWVVVVLAAVDSIVLNVRK